MKNEMENENELFWKAEVWERHESVKTFMCAQYF